MNRTFKTVALLIALTVLFSFAQDGVVKTANKPIFYDTVTVHRVISDSVTIKALENSQSFYDTAFKDIQGSYSTFLTRIVITVAFIGVIVSIFGLLATIYFRDAKKSKEEISEQLEEQRKLLSKFKEELNNEFKKQFENYTEKTQEKFDTSFRYLSRIYRKSAEEFLKDKEYDFQEYLYYMHIFYKCLIKIETLNKYDLNRLERTHKLLLDNSNKNIKKIIKLENEYNICWYIIHLLRFIKRCYDIKLSEHFVVAKLIYNNIFTLNLADLTSNKKINIIEELENCKKKDEYKDINIEDILELAKDYKNGENL